MLSRHAHYFSIEYGADDKLGTGLQSLATALRIEHSPGSDQQVVAAMGRQFLDDANRIGDSQGDLSDVDASAHDSPHCAYGVFIR
jgi:hypothetical protein